MQTAKREPVVVACISRCGGRTMLQVAIYADWNVLTRSRVSFAFCKSSWMARSRVELFWNSLLFFFHRSLLKSCVQRIVEFHTISQEFKIQWNCVNILYLDEIKEIEIIPWLKRYGTFLSFAAVSFVNYNLHLCIYITICNIIYNPSLCKYSRLDTNIQLWERNKKSEIRKRNVAQRTCRMKQTLKSSGLIVFKVFWNSWNFRMATKSYGEIFKYSKILGIVFQLHEIYWKENRGDYFPRVTWASFAFPTLEYPGIPLRSVSCTAAAFATLQSFCGAPRQVNSRAAKMHPRGIVRAALSAVVPATLAVRKLPSVNN